MHQAKASDCSLYIVFPPQQIQTQMSGSSSVSPQSLLADSPENPALDELQPCLDSGAEKFIADFGWPQLVQSALVLLARFFDAQQTFISVYTDAEPSWHCTNSSTPSCNSSANVCKLPESSWAWNGSPDKTIISEWGLECASSFIRGLPASSFFVGCLTGGFALGTLGDSSLGRKNLLSLSCLTMSLAALATVFSSNVWTYSACRFVSGFGRASIGATALVLSTEKVGSQSRGQVVTASGILFALGLLSLPGVAYTSRDCSWRTIYVWTSVPVIFYCVVVQLFVLESPRWLLLHGRIKEALATLKQLASTKIDNFNFNLDLSSNSIRKETSEKTGLYSTNYKDLIRLKWARQRLSIVMLTGFGIGNVYYSMPLAVGNLGYDIYLSIVLNALVEIPAYIIFSIVISKWNRKKPLLAFTTLSGICSMMCMLDWKGLQIASELITYMTSCTAFIMLMIYTLELFPTCVRNTAASMVRQALVFSAVFSPILISAGRRNKFLSYGVFGMVVLGCSFFVLLLPETNGVPLSDTLEEQERKEGLVSSS